MKPGTRDTAIAIVGAGFSGLGAAIRLRQAQVRDFFVFERAGDVGGTWRDNTYPGCACDVESHLYSFSFAPNPGWTRVFSPQAEILEYLRRCARDYGILPHVRFGHELREARWDERLRRWRLETSRGPFTARVLIAGMGGLSEPFVPELSGLSSFAGRAFHSARWDHAHDLTGKSVAVIGTGASAVQIVPAIQPVVRRLRVFQRTPAWVVPRVDRRISDFERLVFRALPLTQRLQRAALYAKREAYLALIRHEPLMKRFERFAIAHLHASIADRELRAKLTPSYRIGCKRVLVSSDYYPALTRANVDVVTSPILHASPGGIVTADGVEHEVDTLIFGTGFRVTDMPAADRIRGKGDRTLNEAWKGSPEAYLGTTTAGFPNLFLLLGPNTGLGHTSVVLMVERQLELVSEALEYMRAHGLATIEPRAEVQARYVSELHDCLGRQVWATGGCRSWYFDATGRNSALWPETTFSFGRRARFRPGDYLFGAAGAL